MGDIQDELRLKGRIELGDKVILYAGEWMLLQQGDTYIGQVGNDSPEILTMRRREVQKRRRGDAEGKVFPKERKKPLFNLHEVIRVSIIDNPNPPKEKKDEPGPRRNVQAEPRAEDRPVGRPGTSQVPRPNRPVPVDPRRAGKTNYGAASTQRARGGTDTDSPVGDSDGGNAPAGDPA